MISTYLTGSAWNPQFLSTFSSGAAWPHQPNRLEPPIPFYFLFRNSPAPPAQPPGTPNSFLLSLEEQPGPTSPTAWNPLIPFYFLFGSSPALTSPTIQNHLIPFYTYIYIYIQIYCRYIYDISTSIYKTYISIYFLIHALAKHLNSPKAKLCNCKTLYSPISYIQPKLD